MQDPQYHIMEALEKTHWWFVAKRGFISSLLPVPDGTLRILDIGAGTGGTSAYLERWGIVDRIEPSPIAGRYLREKKLRFSPDGIETAKLSENSYDAVFLLDVLYHKTITDEPVVLKKIFASLKPNGSLLITDSAIPWLTANHDTRMHARKRYWLGEIPPLAAAAGFTIERQSYCFFFVFPIFIFFRLLNKVMDFDTVAAVPPVINAFLIALCEVEARLLRFVPMPIGSSVIVLLKKPA